MNDLRTAAQQALEAMSSFESGTGGLYEGEFSAEIAALRAALADQDRGWYTIDEINAKFDPEPVALDWLHKWANQDDGEPETQWHEGYEAARRVVQIHLASPPQRKPLTEEEIDSIWDSEKAFADIYAIARAIERAHGIKDAGCDHCCHVLYAATKCRNCGRVTE